MKNWHMIIGLPKSGSSWLGNIIGKNNNGRYFREYFNPWTWRYDNTSLKDTLLEAFGYENKIENIAKPWYENLKIEEVFEKTWNFSKEEKIIDKEVWSFCNVEFFYKNFNISIIHRKADLIFWGNGVDNNNDAFLFYKSIYESFVRNADLYDEDIRSLLNAKTVLNKCLVGHEIATKILFQQAEEFNLPIIDYEELLLKGGKILKNKIHPDLFNEELVKNINDTKFGDNFVKRRKKQHKIKDIRFL